VTIGESAPLTELGALTECDAVVLDASVAPRAAGAVAEARARTGKRTIVDVVDPAASTELLDICDAATTPTRAAYAAIREGGVPVRLLPRLFSRSRLEELRAARVLPGEDRVLGVRIESRAPGDAAALAAGVLEQLDAGHVSTVEWAGPPELLPPPLRSDPRVVELGSLELATVAAWVGQAWIGPPGAPADLGWPAALVEAAYLGVPTACTASGAGEVDDPLICRWALAEPTSATSWSAALDHVLRVTADEDRDDLASRAELRYGVKAGASVVNRILGWARDGSPRR
jgi:hypothetical protein